MCGGVYEEDFEYSKNDAPRKDEQVSKDEEQSTMESRNRRVMGDIKFMTAQDFMDEQEDDGYCTPGSDPQV